MAHVDEEKLDAWIDGALSGSEADAIRDHLKTCPACSEKARAFRALGDALEALPGTPVDAALARETLGAFRREIRGESLLAVFRENGTRLRRLALGAVAAGLLAGLLLGRAAAPLMMPGTENPPLVAMNGAAIGGSSDPYFSLLVMEENL